MGAGCAYALVIYLHAHVSFALQGLPGSKGEQGEKVGHNFTVCFSL